MNDTIKKTIEMNVKYSSGSQKSLTAFKETMTELTKMAKSPSFDKALNALREYNKLLDQTAKKKNEIAKVNKKDKTLGDYYKVFKSSLNLKGAGVRMMNGMEVSSVGVAIAVLKAIYESTLKISNELYGLNFAVKENLNEIKQKVRSWTDAKTGMATYDIGSSLYTNSKARQQQMLYGFSSAKNFAYSETSKLLGIESMEDLFYLNSAQREIFGEYMDKFSDFYTEMQSSGVLKKIQQIEMEFKLFKTEMSMELLGFLSENKEMIISGLRGLLEITKAVLKIGTWIVEIGSMLASVFGFAAGAGVTNNTTTYNITGNISGGSTEESKSSFTNWLSTEVKAAVLGEGE